MWPCYTGRFLTTIFNANKLAQKVDTSLEIVVCNITFIGPQVCNYYTVEPRFNEVPGDWEIGSLYRGFVKSKTSL